MKFNQNGWMVMDINIAQLDDQQFYNLKIVFKEDTIFRKLDDEMIIIDMNSGKYFGLNETGARIWTLLNEFNDIKKVQGSLLDEYNISEEECLKELKRFLQTIYEKGLVDVKKNN